MMIFNAPMPSFAAGTLVDCEKSPAFTKRLNTSVKKLEGRLAKYKEGTPPYLALQELAKLFKMLLCFKVFD